MNPSAIEEEALHLPVAERARLARKLLESMDDLDEAEADELWAEDVVRRAGQVDDGSVSLVSLDELEQRVQARLK